MIDDTLFDLAPLKERKVEMLENTKRPILLAYGMGADSTAMAMGLRDLRIRPDAVMFADTGGEGKPTYSYERVFRRWLKRASFPELTVVKYKPKVFKNYPPYHDLETNCLSNGTLPSLAFGFKSCSLKWKAAPQETWCKRWPRAQQTWAHGERVMKLIGFDASPGDIRRRNHAGGLVDEKYEYRYPLQEWGWTRDQCLQRIIDERIPGWHPGYLQHTQAVTDAWIEVAKEVMGRDQDAFQGAAVDLLLAKFQKAVKTLRKAAYWVEKGGVPMKSSCFFCPAMKVWEVSMLPVEKLERIVIMEARAKPRHHTCEGLWRKATKLKPGSMTEFIRLSRLLPETRIEKLQSGVPTELMNAVTGWRGTGKEIDWEEFFADNGVKAQGFCGEPEGA